MKIRQKAIDSFQGKFRFLSNFWDSPVSYEGVTYPTVENAYQAAKTTNLEERVPFFDYTPGQAKKAGSKLKIRSDWETKKFLVMKELVASKFRDPKLEGWLLNTAEAELIEGNNWNDTIWGCSWDGEKWVGQNNLGKILMEVRQEIKSKK